MLKQVLFASAALALLAAPSLAATTPANETSVSISGTVQAVCSITNTTPSVTLSNFFDPTTGLILANATTAPFVGSAWCNGNGNTLTVVAHPLLNPAYTSAPDGFTNKIDYTLTTTALPLTGSLSSTAAAGVTVNSLPPFTGSGSGSGTVTPIVTTDKVLAGTYTGIVNVTLTPGS